MFWKKNLTNRGRGVGWVPISCMGGQSFLCHFSLSRKALAETFRSVKIFILCFHLIFPAILLLLRCNVVWFGVDYGLWINDLL